MSGLFWLASYPKSGNTWFRAFLVNFIADGDTPVDINDLKSGAIASDRCWLDDLLAVETSDLRQDEIDQLRAHVYDWSARSGDTGYHKIHDGYRAQGATAPLVGVKGTRGALYILRNPLDVVPSYANHMGCSVDAAIARMADPDHALSRSHKRLAQQVRQSMGTWSDHVRGWVDAPELPRHVLRYEDMKGDPVRHFTAAARFLGLPDDAARIDKAIRFSDFRVLAAQEAEKGFCEAPASIANGFFRAGVSGGWRQQLTCEQVARVVADHGPVMARFGYLDAEGRPV